MEKSPVFITGGTGYIGKRLIRILLNEGYDVTALVREQSIKKLPDKCKAVIGSPFDSKSYVNSIPTGCIFIHLIGVNHPGPKKKLLFYSVDLASLKVSVEAAKQAGVKHFIYMSVAQHPTRVMADYQKARRQGEETVLASGLTSTFIRPWYVVGPGHYWPVLFQPVFKLMEIIPSTSVQAKALALVSLKKMLLIFRSTVVNTPKEKNNIIEVQDIKNANHHHA
jgi:nucleoside-diphosphate-sugar epimerase